MAYTYAFNPFTSNLDIVTMTTGTTDPHPSNDLLLEDGSFMLQEDGASTFLLEDGASSPITYHLWQEDGTSLLTEDNNYLTMET
jgi:hypothetical protein